jgi:phosphohistidine phosphatase
MKRLIIMRHGKTEEVKADDFSRNLIEEGLKENQIKISALKTKLDCSIDVIIHSAANRTSQTAKMAAKDLSVSMVLSSDKMYMGSVDNYLEEVYAIDDKYDTMMLVGHNPTVTTMAYQFDPMLQAYLKTSEIVVVDLDLERWVDLDFSKVNNVKYV